MDSPRTFAVHSSFWSMHSNDAARSPQATLVSSVASSSTGWAPPDRRRAPFRRSQFALANDMCTPVGNSLQMMNQNHMDFCTRGSPTSPGTHDVQRAAHMIPLSPLARPLLTLETLENASALPPGSLARRGLKRRVTALLSSLDESMDTDDAPAPDSARRARARRTSHDDISFDASLARGGLR